MLSNRFVFIFLALICASFFVNNASAQICTYATGTNGSNKQQLTKCVPSTVRFEVFFEFDASVTAEPAWDPNLVEFLIDWGDGTTETFSLLSASPNLISFVQTTSGFTFDERFTMVAQHVYVASAECVNTAIAFLQYNAAPPVGGFCPGLFQDQPFEAWNTDDFNGGMVSIVDNLTEVCVDNDFSVILRDASTFNCNDDLTPTPQFPNEEMRWVRFEYGDVATGNANRIPNVFVGGVQVTDATGALIGAGPGGIHYDNQGVAFDGVIEYPDPSEDPFAVTLPITMTSTGAEDIGDVFRVYLHNWNQCNKYTDAAAPIIDFAEIVIIGPTDPTNPVDNEYCAGDAMTAISVDPPGIGIVEWYDALTGGALAGTGASFIPPTDGTFFAQYVDGACVSDNRVAATLTENPLPTQATVGADHAVCRSFASPSDPLGGNAPGVGETGSWAAVSGPDTSDVIFTSTTDPNTVATVFNIANAGLYEYVWTITDGTCTTSASIFVDYQLTPTVPAAGPDSVTCFRPYQFQGNAPDPGRGIGQWTQVSGPGTSAFDDDALPNATVIVNIVGVYEYRWAITNACQPDPSLNFDLVQIEFTALPTSTIAPLFEVCQDDVLNLDTNANSALGIQSYNWFGADVSKISDITSGNPVFDTSVPGSFEVRCTITDNNDCAILRVVDVTVFGAPTSAISSSTGSFSICEDEVMSLDGNSAVGMTNGGAITNRLWSGTGVSVLDNVNSETPNVDTSLPGDYDLTYTVTDANTCSNSENITITIFENPTPAIMTNTGSFDACVGIAYSIDGNPIIGGINGGLITNHAWSGTGSGVLSDLTIQNPVVNTTIPGTYDLTYTVTDANTCTATQNVTVTIFAVPTAGITTSNGTLVVCQGAPFSLDGNPVIGVPNGGGIASHLWTGTGVGVLNNSTIQAPTVDTSTSGTFDLTYTVTDVNSCTASDMISITVLAPPVTNPPAGAIEACVGEVLSYIIPGSNPATSTYFWDLTDLPGAIITGGGDPFPFISIQYGSAMTNRTLSVRETVTLTGCMGVPVDLNGISIFDPPVIDAGSSESTCEGIPFNLAMSGTPPTAINFTSIQWNHNGFGSLSGSTTINPIYTPGAGDAGFTIRLTLSAFGNSTCGNVSDFMELFINPAPSITLGPDLLTCEADPVILNPFITGTFTTLSWQQVSGSNLGVFSAPNSANTSFTPDPADFGSTITLRLTATGSCNTEFAELQLQINEVATVDPGLPDDFCVNELILLDGTVTGPTTSIMWSTTTAGFFADASNPQTTFTPAPSITGPVIFTLQATNAPCSFTDALVTHTINETPDAVISNNSPQICAADMTDIDFDSSVPNSTFTWIATTSGAAVGGASDQLTPLAAGKITQILTNSSTAPQSVTYTITATGEGTSFCPGQTQIAVVTILPTPNIDDDNKAPVICNGEQTDIDLLSDVSGTTFTWNVTYSNASLSGGTDELAGAPIGTNISHTLLNTSASSQTAFYNIMATGPAILNCPGETKIIQVVVEPTPDLTVVDNNDNFCSGSAANIDLSANGAGTIISWTATASDPGVSGFGPGSSTSPFTITDMITNGTNRPQTVTYEINSIGAFSLNCPSTTSFETITIDPAPNIIITNSPDEICSGDFTNILFNGDVLNTTFVWTAVPSDASVLSGFADGSGIIGTIIQQTLVNTSNVRESVLYTISAIGPGPTLCPAQTSPEFRTVFVDPAPMVIATNNNPEICDGEMSSITLTSIVPGSTFTWTTESSNPSVVPPPDEFVGQPDGFIISEVISNPTDLPQSVTFSIQATGPAGSFCLGPIETVTVVIQPSPGIVVTNNEVDICDGEPTDIDLFSPVGGTTFNWTAIGSTPNVSNFMNGTGLPVGFTIEQSLINSGTAVESVDYQITAFGPTGCEGDSETTTVIVHPTPLVVELVGNSQICSGSAVNIQLSSNVPGAEFTWLIVNSSSSVSGGIPQITPQPIGTVITDNLFNSSDIPQTVIYQIQPIGPLPTNCPGPMKEITITVDPTPELTVVENIVEVCSGEAIDLDLLGSVPNSIVRWTVLPSAASVGGATPNTTTGLVTDANIAHVLTNSSDVDQTVEYTFEITGPAPTSCLGNMESVTIVIHPTPSFDNPLTDVICSNQSINFTPTGPVVGTSYNWTSAVTAGTLSGNSANGFGNISDNLVNTGFQRATVTYTVTPESNGCIGLSDFYIVNVDPKPDVSNPIPELVQVICADDNAVFNPIGNVLGTTYSWVSTVDFGTVTINTPAGNGTINDQLDNPGPGQSQVTYTIVPEADGCIGDAVDFIVTINPKPIAEIIGPEEICIGESIELLFQFNQGRSPYDVVYRDDLGNSFSALGVLNGHSELVSPTVNTSYTLVSVEDENGCLQTDPASLLGQIDVNVNQLPDVVMTPIGDGCIGTQLDFVITSTSPGPWEITYQEDPDGSVVSTNVIVLSASQAINVFPSVQTTYTIFKVRDLTTFCEGTVSGTGVIAGLDQLSIDFDVTPLVRVVNENPMIFDFNSTLTITPNPGAISEGDVTYNWDMGDGNTISGLGSATANIAHANGAVTSGTFADPSHTYLQDPGSYKIDLEIVYGSCTDNATRTIQITPIPPIAQFTATPSVGCLPITVLFDAEPSQFENQDRYIWDFGDGTISVGTQQIEHTYFFPGIYSVSLRVSNETGITDEEFKQDLIVVYDLPLAAFRSRPFELVEIPTQSLITANLSIGATFYTWDFGDGHSFRGAIGDEIDTTFADGSRTFNTIEDPEHIYVIPGEYEVFLIAENDDGCMDTVSIEIKVVEEEDIRVPNVFTPSLGGPNDSEGNVDINNMGGGNVNDIFIPQISNFALSENFELKVFDRWGNLLFESFSQRRGWDGYYKGKLAKQDVYVYKVRVKLENGDFITSVGDVTLIR